MDIPGLKKVGDAIGDAFSVFDFSFFISGAVTLGFIAIDLHYYGHDGVLKLKGWESVMIYIIAVYVCGLMSWSCGKFFRWLTLHLFWWKKKGIEGDFDDQIKKYIDACGHQNDAAVNLDREVLYTKMWLRLNKCPELAGKIVFLNKMWVMVAVYEGLTSSWIVGLMVYLDGWLIGHWIKTDTIFLNIFTIAIFIILIICSMRRAIVYSRDLIKEITITYYENQ